MTRDEAIEKAKKLLRLAQSDNVHEAALAAQRAQEILERYELTASVLDRQEQDEQIVDYSNRDEPLERQKGKQLATWKNYLSAIVANANGCKTFIRWEWTVKPSATERGQYAATLHIVGRPSDAGIVRYFYIFFCGEIERLCLRDCKGKGRTYHNQYRLGVVDTIKDRLKEARQTVATSIQLEYQNNPNALVKLDQALARLENKTASVEAWLKEHMTLKEPQGPKFYADPTARAAGRRAGKEIEIQSGQRASLGPAKKRICS